MNMMKSINIAEDLRNVAAIEAYRPTAKTMPVVKAIVGVDGSAATNVVAAYGSGKSIAALAAVSLLRRAHPVAKVLEERLASADPAFGAHLAPLRRERAMVVLLRGYCADLKKAIAREAQLRTGESLSATLKALLNKARRNGMSRIAFVWDEFGHHLETLVRDGDTERLLELQDLAEWAVRRTAITVTVTTLMHQGASHYTARAKRAARNAWRKIEGRFETVVLADEGMEGYELIADWITARRGNDADSSMASFTQAARTARTHGLFTRANCEEALARLLARAAPLSPAALEALPWIASRVGQNDRTIAAFLQTLDPVAEAVGLDALYDFFASAMRADTGAGGTHRRYVEAETALSRTETELERRIVKTVAMLQVGGSTERPRLSYERLIFSLASDSEKGVEAIEAGVCSLIERRVLLHRRRADDVCLWHGADLDLEPLLAEAAANAMVERDLVAEIDRLFPREPYVALGYNLDYAMTRFAPARCVTLAALGASGARERWAREADAEDALVLLVIDGDEEGVAGLEELEQWPEHAILAVPRARCDLLPMIADLVAIDSVAGMSELVQQDPLIEKELADRRAEVLAAIGERLDMLVDPDRGGVLWFSAGRRFSFDDGGSTDDVLSGIMRGRFRLAPRVRNEQVNRRRISSVSRSARRRCLLGVIERSGTPSLGFEGATSADASIYRTVFERTGLYDLSEDGWSWREPSALTDTDPGLAEAWHLIRDFFAEPSDRTKPLARLVADLSGEPIGLRPGLLPLLGGAGLQAFGRALALREQVDGGWRYVDDIQPSLVERLFEEPERFDLEVPSLDKAEVEEIWRIVDLFTDRRDPHEPEALRAFYDALLAWRASLPTTALTARGLGKAASRLQPLLRPKSLNPADLLLRAIPSLVGSGRIDEGVRTFLVTAKSEIEGVIEHYAGHAELTAWEIFEGRTNRSCDDLVAAAEAWARCLPSEAAKATDLDLEARGVLTRSMTASRSSSRAFAKTLSGIMFGLDFDAWDDRIAVEFAARLEGILVRTEEWALASATDRTALAPLVRNRIVAELDRYREAMGEDGLRACLMEIMGGRP